ncbi:protein OS-9-like [Paramacrobiotus metropolitanus]|uniref:protein OS-9-like n=1 Tax=Paramacrobiotus metropolitanus TaxID=2943436 RepID=UPI0024461A98|nr:protein OS-9-like [Paramacrobiotus metropolitanus]
MGLRWSRRSLSERTFAFSVVVILQALLQGILVPVHAASPYGIGSFGDNGVYNIVISKKRVEPQNEAIEEAAGSYVTMLNRKGRPFRCSIPSIPARVDEKDKLINLTTSHIEEILIPVESNRQCIQLVTSGWWHYEFCYGKNIVQFHRENGVKVPPIIELGKYSHSQDWSGVSKDALKKKPQDRYHMQYFVNGTECDLTNQRRETRVKFFCDTHKWPTDYIESVTEPQSCMYEVNIFSRRLCSIPYFKKEEPVIGEITCNPVNVPKSDKKKTKKSSDPLVIMGKDLVENLLNEAASPVPESEMTDIKIVPGESDSEAGIQNELRQASEKMDYKLFKNSKFFIEKDASMRAKQSSATGKPLTADESDEEEEDLHAEVENAAKSPNTGAPVSFIEQAKIRAIFRGLDWVEREDIAKALLRIDFKNLGKLSEDEDLILQKFARILKMSKGFAVEDESIRKEAIRSCLDEYAEMVELFVSSPNVRAVFQDSYEEVFRLLHSMMKIFVAENEAEEIVEAKESESDEESLPDDIEITEEMLGDGMKLAEAIKKLDFFALAPLLPAEETLFEALVDISERMMEAHMLYPVQPEDVYTLMESFEDELVAVKRSMDKNTEARKLFKHKLNQFIRLLLASLNHWFAAAPLDDSTPQEKAATLKDDVAYAEKWAKKAVQMAKGSPAGDITPEKIYADSDQVVEAVQDLDDAEDEMSSDEKSVSLLIWKGMEKTAILASKDRSVNSEEKRAALRKARVIMKYVAELLKDPTKNIRPSIREKLLERVETMIASLGKYEKTEKSLTEIREARQKLEAGADFETWLKQYAKTIEKANAVHAENVKDQVKVKQPVSAKKQDSPFLPFGRTITGKGTQPKSKAVKFGDIIADMNPTNRKIREIEDLIREKLQSMGGGPIEIKLVTGGDRMAGMGDIDMHQLEHIKKSLAGAFAAQLQGVFQQQFSVNELEENYSLDDDED